MKLVEAYKRLEFAPPVEHERRTMASWSGKDEGPLRRLGTSVRMLVELYLDLERATKSLGFGQLHQAKFLCVCLSPPQATHLQHELNHIHAALALDVDVAQVRFFPHDGGEHIVRSHLYRTWGIFCDHAVKELKGGERTHGPYGLVRTIKRDGDTFHALDRDDRRVCRLTYDGKNALINESTCPIHYHESPHVSSTTFPAWIRDDINSSIRMARAFEL